MKKFTFIIAFIFSIFVQNSFSKGVEVVNDTILKDGTPYAIIEIVKMGFGDYEFRIKNLLGQELIYCKHESYNKPNPNPNVSTPAREVYYEVQFPDFKKFAEIGGNELGFSMISKTKTAAKIAQLIVDNNLIIDNKIDQGAMEKFIFRYATKYSDKRKELLEREIIIIR